MIELSIITVNFNNGKGLSKTYNSIKSQNWKNFEWIIIDANSSDNSRDIIKVILEQNDVNIAYWCSETDSGIYNGMNKGIYHASGKYLNFMNSGDTFYDSSTLSNVFKEDHHEDILYGDWIFLSDESRKYNSFPSPFDIYDLFERNICHQAMFIRTDWHKKHRYDESFRILADYNNWICAALSGASFKYIPICVCICELGGISNTASELLYKEQKRIKYEVWTKPVLRTLLRFHELSSNPLIIKAEKLCKEGGIKRKILSFVLNKIL